MQHCPCGLSKQYLDCCGRFIEGNIKPATPEELMRSRYTAYTQSNIEYIAKTMRAPANDGFDPDDARQWAKSVTWIKLEVISTAMDGSRGYVEFIAHFKQGSKLNFLHEISEFSLQNGEWFYVDGKMKS